MNYLERRLQRNMAGGAMPYATPRGTVHNCRGGSDTRIDLVTRISVLDRAQPVGKRGGQPPPPQSLFRSEGIHEERRTRRKWRTSEWPFFMHESVNYGIEVGGARGCRGSVMPPPSPSVLPRVLSGSSPMGLKLCRNFKYPPFLLSTCSENGDDKS